MTRPVLALLLVLLTPAPVAADLLVTVGDVTARTAQLWLEAPAPGPVDLRLDPAVPVAGGGRLIAGEGGRARVTLRGLEPGRRYRYRLRAAGTTVEGTFLTAPAPDDPAPVRLAWSGDLGARGHCRTPQGWRAVDAVAERRPDLVLLVGDTIYADHVCRPPAVPGAAFVATTLEEFRARHRYNRADPAVQRLMRRTSVSAIWDDHDVRNNFAGPSEPLAAIGRQAFLDYWPVATPQGEPGRLHRRLRWGGLLEIFVLDTRSYRSRNWRPDGPDKTMLGDAQRRWLLDAVARSTARWKVLVSTVPLSIQKGWPFADSWARRNVLGWVTGFASERDAILRAVHAHGIDRLVVLTADVHFGAFMTHRPRPGLVVHELVAGPLAAREKAPQPPVAGLGTQVHLAHGGTPTFGELTVDRGGLTARLFDGDGRLLGATTWPP